MARKKYDDAVAKFQQGLAYTPDNPNLLTRMASAQVDAKKYDDAIASLNKVLGQANLNPTVKKIAEDLKKKAEQAKTAK
jgi:tetratricopeptide (TPR) repeat protein